MSKYVLIAALVYFLVQSQQSQPVFVGAPPPPGGGTGSGDWAAAIASLGQSAADVALAITQKVSNS